MSGLTRLGAKLGGRLPDFEAAVRRFPVVVAAMAALTCDLSAQT